MCESRHPLEDRSSFLSSRRSEETLPTWRSGRKSYTKKIEFGIPSIELTRSGHYFDGVAVKAARSAAGKTLYL
jgi:hypothetical protein